MVVSVHQVNASTVIGFALSAGSITFLDRASMKEIVPDQNYEMVSSMPQSGFVFTNDKHCKTPVAFFELGLDAALSPNCCLSVSISADGEPTLNYPEYALGSINKFDDLAKATAAKVVLALQWVYSCTHHNNNDDVLAIVKCFLNPKLEHDFLAEVYNALQVNIDYAADGQQDKLLRYPWIQRCLSLQYSLDYTGEIGRRSIAAKVAWTILNMRIASLTYAVTFNFKDKSAGPGGYGQWARPGKLISPAIPFVPRLTLILETMPSLLGVFAWQLDVMNFIIDELYSLKHLLKDYIMDRERVKAQITKLNTPALSLLLASSSRGFIRYNLRALNLVAGGKVNMSAVPVDAHNSFMDMIDSSPISISQFEHIIADLDNSVRSTYEASGMSETERTHVEKNMVIETDIPEVLMPAVERLLTSTLENLQPEIDRAALYFKDVSWLGLSDDRKTEAYRKNNVVDAIRKVPLRKGTKLRRCTRCCALMEDVSRNRQTSAWMHNVQKLCFCGCLWMLI
ncbi:MAG: hypothetical protein M1812_007137 [Candelaria pacifica]|nr:MAG: hypothetical protein M1812_007137 [Candelaria pacifica]